MCTVLRLKRLPRGPLGRGSIGQQAGADVPATIHLGARESVQAVTQRVGIAYRLVIGHLACATFRAADHFMAHTYCFGQFLLGPFPQQPYGAQPLADEFPGHVVDERGVWMHPGPAQINTPRACAQGGIFHGVRGGVLHGAGYHGA